MKQFNQLNCAGACLSIKTLDILKYINNIFCISGCKVIVLYYIGLQVVQASELAVCVNKKSGAWRPVSSGIKCNKKEDFTSLNNFGPQGPIGALLLLDSKNVDIGYYDPYTSKTLVHFNQKYYIIEGVTERGFTNQGLFMYQKNYLNPEIKLEAASFYPTTDCSGEKYFVAPSVDVPVFDNIPSYAAVDSQKLYTIDPSQIINLTINSKYDPSYTIPTCLNQNQGIYGTFQPTIMRVIPARGLEFVYDLSIFIPPFSVSAP